ncbi:hypothetical protein [Virgibacillus siamensis]|uniref:hypothetical protein n=1 Tax=Virgibacillus siamensis TaxID=480071 RepID=UPI00098723CB|nr:hypothetical protein [Virgibacillus siamensis]
MDNKFKFKHRMSDTTYYAEREGEEVKVTGGDGGEINFKLEAARQFVSDGDWTIIPDNYEETGKEIGKLVESKQKQYGDSFGKSGDFLKILYPDGIQPDQYKDMLAVVRIFDKQMRIANGNQGEENAFRDIAGYSLLSVGKS